MNKKIKMNHSIIRWVSWLSFLSLLVFAGDALAGGGTLGTMASSITSTFKAVGKLITAGSYIAGLGFSVAAIMKFKQHKDNPTQITVGTPIALVFIGAALLFLPTLLQYTGSTMFGEGKAKTAGPGGTKITGS